MQFTTLLSTLLLTSTTGWAQYTLQEDYMSGDFFSKFSFFTGPDPTQGFVQYMDQGSAQQGGLLGTGTGVGSIRLGVDSTSTTTTGRGSVRLTSKASYQSGLVVIDLAHMPGGICGTWPAFWMVGPNWPSQGEIDIIEGVNDQATNQMTLHTGSQCSIGGTSMLGSVFSNNCDVSSGDNTGCAITSKESSSYGAGFNRAGGGTYATEWTSSSISVYFWPRGQEPADLNSGSPNPATWGEPQAHFAGSCDIARSFTNQQIVFDTTFCGQWAGEVWDGSTCARSTGTTCEAFVGQNPSAFKEAYWEINALKVYSGSGSAASPSGGAQPSYGASGMPSGAPSTFATMPSGRPSNAPGRPSGQPPFGPKHSGAAPSFAPQPSGNAGPSFAPQPSGQASTYAPQPSGHAPSGGAQSGGAQSYAPPAPSSPPQGSAPAPSGAPAPSAPARGPPGGPRGGRHRHGGFRGPPGAANYVEAATNNVATTYIMPRATDTAAEDARRRHLELHKHAHGHLHGGR